MKILIALLFSSTVFAKEWTVTHRGHSYRFKEEGRLHLKSEKVNLEIKKQACSDFLVRSLVRKFEASLKPKIKNPKKVSDMIKVEASGESFYVSAASKNGKHLRTFPDIFVEASVSEKVLCKK